MLFEAFGTGLPIVATSVGGVPGAVEDDALLIPPGDSQCAVEGLRRAAGDEKLRTRLITCGVERARERTLEKEVGRVAALLRDA